MNKQKLRSCFFVVLSILFGIGFIYSYFRHEPPETGPSIKLLVRTPQEIKIAIAEVFPDYLVIEKKNGNFEVVHPCVAIWESEGNDGRNELRMFLAKKNIGDVLGWHFDGDKEMTNKLRQYFQRGKNANRMD